MWTRVLLSCALLALLPACDKDRPRRDADEEDDHPSRSGKGERGEERERDDDAAKDDKDDGPLAGNLDEDFSTSKRSVDKLIERLAERLGVTMAMDADIHEFADCQFVTVVSPRRTSKRVLLEACRRAVASIGLDLQVDGSVLKVVKKAGTSPPPACRKPALSPPRYRARPGSLDTSVADPPDPPPGPRIKRPKSAAEIRPVSEWIKKVGPNEYEVTKADLDAFLDSSALLNPKYVRPRPDGLEIKGVPHELAAFGLEDGDVITEINGFNLKDPEGALEAYAKLRTAAFYTVKLRRAGKEITLMYRVVP